MQAVFSCQGGGGGDGAARQRGDVPLPCLNSNNCTEPVSKLTGNHRKTAFILGKSVAWMVERHGLGRVGFLTLTFADHILDAREAQKRFHSLATHVLDVRYPGRWIRVLERQKSGRIHYHLLIGLDEDIRMGADFEAFEREDYRSANPALRAEWSFWRTTAPKFRFGRTEVLPVKSGAEAVGKYVGKYIAKHIEKRQDSDKGVRLVSAAKGALIGSVKFGWVSPRARLWRLKLAETAKQCGFKTAEEFKIAFGQRWAWALAGEIMRVDLVAGNGGRFTYPDAATAIADGAEVQEDFPGPVVVERSVYDGNEVRSSGNSRVVRVRKAKVVDRGPEHRLEPVPRLVVSGEMVPEERRADGGYSTPWAVRKRQCRNCATSGAMPYPGWAERSCSSEETRIGLGVMVAGAQEVSLSPSEPSTILSKPNLDAQTERG